MKNMMCYQGSCHSGMGRSFLTKEEKVEMLKDYKDALDKESQGIQERIAEIQKSK